MFLYHSACHNDSANNERSCAEWVLPALIASRRIWPFQTFNSIQSALFPTVAKSDRNVVVSAPTGCGKVSGPRLPTCKPLEGNTKAGWFSSCRMVFLCRCPMAVPDGVCQWHSHDQPCALLGYAGCLCLFSGFTPACYGCIGCLILRTTTSSFLPRLSVL